MRLGYNGVQINTCKCQKYGNCAGRFQLKISFSGTTQIFNKLQFLLTRMIVVYHKMHFTLFGDKPRTLSKI